MFYLGLKVEAGEFFIELLIPLSERSRSNSPEFSELVSTMYKTVVNSSTKKTEESRIAARSILRELAYFGVEIVLKTKIKTN